MPISNVKNIVFSGDSLVFASTPSGVQSFNRNTKKWCNLGLHHVEAVAVSSSNILYASTYDDGFYKSKDFGSNWSLTNLTADTLFSAYTIEVLPDETILVATELNLRSSTDFGESWNVLPVGTNYYSRGISINNNFNIWTVGWGGQNYIVYKSTDSGLTFNQIYSGVGQTDNNSISAFENITIIADNIFDNGIYRSTDYGLNWENISINNSNFCVHVQENGSVFIGNSTGILHSTDFGDSWANISTPLKSNNAIREIEHDNLGKLFFGTFNEGLFEVDYITNLYEIINESPEEYILYQNYPNPFNPSTIITFSITEKSFVSLRVLDVLGKEVVKLVDQIPR